MDFAIGDEPETSNERGAEFVDDCEMEDSVPDKIELFIDIPDIKTEPIATDQNDTSQEELVTSRKKSCSLSMPAVRDEDTKVKETEPKNVTLKMEKVDLNEMDESACPLQYNRNSSNSSILHEDTAYSVDTQHKSNCADIPENKRTEPHSSDLEGNRYPSEEEVEKIPEITSSVLVPLQTKTSIYDSGMTKGSLVISNSAIQLKKEDSQAPCGGSLVTSLVDYGSSESDSESSSSEEDSSSDSDTESLLSSEPEVVADSKETRKKQPMLPLVTPSELMLKDLPSVEYPQINLATQAEMARLGKVSSIIGQLVVIQSEEGTPALNEETVLFKENRQAFGVVFEIFGPVVAPLYMVRFNSTKDITDQDITLNMHAYFAPWREDITNYVFVLQLQSMKGSDASWKDDEEPPQGVVEYSDDEQERMAKKKSNLSREKRKDARQRNHPEDQQSNHPPGRSSSRSARGTGPRHQATNPREKTNGFDHRPKHHMNHPRNHHPGMYQSGPHDNRPMYHSGPHGNGPPPHHQASHQPPPPPYPPSSPPPPYFEPHHHHFVPRMPPQDLRDPPPRQHPSWPLGQEPSWPPRHEIHQESQMMPQGFNPYFCENSFPPPPGNNEMFHGPQAHQVNQMQSNPPMHGPDFSGPPVFGMNGPPSGIPPRFPPMSDHNFQDHVRFPPPPRLPPPF